MLDLIIEYSNYFLVGTRNTVLLALITVICGSLLGSVIALMRLSKIKVISIFARVYITIIRGTPLIVQLFIVYFQLGKWITFPDFIIFDMNMARVLPCLIGLAMNSAAYVAEIIRGGIQAVDKGQMEAARSSGMTNGMAMKLIILPQAIKSILPSIGNEFVTVIKESAVVQYLGVQDLMYNTDIVKVQSFQILPSFYIAALIYLFLTYTTSKLLELYERKLSIQ